MKSNLKEKIYKYLHNFRPWQFSLLTACLFIFFIFLVGPLYSLFSKAFVNKAGAFVGWENYIKYFKNPALSVSVGNTFSISLWATLFSVCIGFAYAYALTRTKIRGKEFFKYMAMIPIFIPTIVHALGLVYLFGKQGILTRAGLVSFELYGKIGIIISEVIYCFPQAFLMFLVALQFADGRLYEVADAMGIPAFKKLWYITLPEIKYTLLNACFVCFTLAFTDFGAPKVIGGSYNVLATDVYKQVAGQFNFNMGAVVGTLLLIPAVVSFIFDRLVTNRNAGSLTAKATTLVIKENKMRDAFFFGLCCLVTAFFLALIATLFLGGLVENYPYNLNLTLQNFNFSVSVGGLASYFNSLKMALFTAIFGTIFVFIFAYLVEKTKGMRPLRYLARLLSVIPMALPGLVVGISFIFFFNNRANPLNFIYGTVTILVISNILHYFSVPFFTASGSLQKLDKEFESVADSMNIPRWKTLLKVSVPLALSAILEIFMYLFVNAMVTVSAVAFLYSAKFRVASIAITHMEEAGNFGQAAAMSILILLINVLVRIFYELAIHFLRKKAEKTTIVVQD